MTSELPRPELSRTVALDRLPAAFTVEATEPECVALAQRLQIPAVRSLWCRFVLRRRGDVVVAEGTLRADVVQSCVVSLDDVEQSTADRFELRFVPAGTERDGDDPEAPDEVPYEGGHIDLGEAATEQLALVLDPYPRRPDAVLDTAAIGDEANPFADLAALRRVD